MGFYSGRTTKQEALGHLDRAVYQKARKVANNTFRYTTEDGVTRIRLHQTDILCLHPDGSVVLNSGGWRTRTTWDRIGEMSRGFHVFSYRGELRVRTTGFIFYGFADGIRIYPDGSCTRDAREVTLRCAFRAVGVPPWALRRLVQAELERQRGNWSQYERYTPPTSLGDTPRDVQEAVADTLIRKAAKGGL
jgi:hypothetical protein